MAFSFALFGSLKANAAGPEPPSRADVSWHVLADYERAIIDKMAADFFEKSLRLAQSRRIEAETPAIYRGLSASAKTEFREFRRQQWRAMTDERQQALRNVKWPAFENLSEDQKLPFRQNAVSVLSINGAIDSNALKSALRSEI